MIRVHSLRLFHNDTIFLFRVTLELMAFLEPKDLL